MASGKTSKNKRKPNIGAVNKRQPPWLMIGGIVVILALAAVFIGYPLVERNEQRAYIPSEANPDPSRAIPGVVTQQFDGGQHISLAQRVAYTQSPPSGGTHDQYWAACSGVVYPTAVRSENLVHSLEHGAVWIGYAPDLAEDQVSELEDIASQNDYVLVSSVEGMDSPVTLSAWGLQVGVDSADDPAVEAFVEEYQQGEQTQEPGASCQGGVGSPL